MLNKKVRYFLSEAFKIAQKSTYGKKYGALLVHKGKIISKGYNSYKKGAFTSGKKTMHAEIDAITQLYYHSKLSLEERRRLSGVDLYVVKCSNTYQGFEDCLLCHDCHIKVSKLIKEGFIKNVFLSTTHKFQSLQNL